MNQTKPALEKCATVFKAALQNRPVYVVQHPRVITFGAYGVKTEHKPFQSVYLTKKAAQQGLAIEREAFILAQRSMWITYQGEPQLFEYSAAEVKAVFNSEDK